LGCAQQRAEVLWVLQTVENEQQSVCRQVGQGRIRKSVGLGGYGLVVIVADGIGQPATIDGLDIDVTVPGLPNEGIDAVRAIGNEQSTHLAALSAQRLGDRIAAV
jgi:hypothetical protein